MSWTCVRDEGQAVIIAQSKNIFAELLTNEKIVCNIQILNGTVRFDRIAAGWSSPVARRAHNPKARGSSPLPATKTDSAGVAQSVERILGKDKVTGSIPVISSRKYNMAA